MKILSILILLAAFVPQVWAQINAVTVDLELDQKQFLSHEDLRVAVRIDNRSGQPLDFGKENDWLTFTVEAREHYVVSQLADVPVVGEFTLNSSKMGTKRVNLTPYFDFREPGRYQITATVKIAQWNKEITSRPITFDIINGTKLKEIDFGVPTTATNRQPEMRKYILQQAIYLKEMRLYVRLADATGSKVFRVFPIGRMTSFTNPEAQVDRQSNLHVLHQTGARSFNYNVINPDGDVITREVHDYTNTRPALRTNSEGKIFVAGGVLRMTSNQVAQPSVKTPETDAQPLKP